MDEGKKEDDLVGKLVFLYFTFKLKISVYKFTMN